MNIFKNNILLIVAIATILALLCSCSADDAQTENAMTVGANGKTILGPDLMRVIIPAGAVDKDIELKIEKVDAPTFGLYRQVGYFYKIEPVDTTFLKAITIEIPYNSELIPKDIEESEVKIWTLTSDLENTANTTEDDLTLTELEGEPDIENDLAKGKSDKLGVFGAAIKLADNTIHSGKLTVSDEFNFSLVLLNQAASNSLLLQNNGDGDLQISKAEIVGDNGFSFAENFEPQKIAADQLYELEIQFIPSAQKEYLAILKISSNDPDRPMVEVQLKGRGSAGASSRLVGDVLDFGYVAKGESKLLILKVMNISLDEKKLMLYDLELDAGAFSLVSPNLPHSIDPDSSVQIVIQFLPTEPDYFQTDMILYLDDIDYPSHEVTLKGSAELSVDGDLDTDRENKEQEQELDISDTEVEEAD